MISFFRDWLRECGWVERVFLLGGLGFVLFAFWSGITGDGPPKPARQSEKTAHAAYHAMTQQLASCVELSLWAGEPRWRAVRECERKMEQDWQQNEHGDYEWATPEFATPEKQRTAERNVIARAKRMKPDLFGMSYQTHKRAIESVLEDARDAGMDARQQRALAKYLGGEELLDAVEPATSATIPNK